MSLRLILIIIGALIIAAILIDGYRHWRKAKKYQENLEKNTQQTMPEPQLGSKKIDYNEELDFTPRINLDTVSEEVRIKPNPNPPPPPAQPKSTVSQPSVKTTQTRTIPEPMPKKNKFIILHVLAEDDTYFSAQALATKFSAQGLRFGAMNIFHQFENFDGSGDVLFSVANAFEPGTLELDNEEDFYTQGLTLFIQLPHRYDAHEAFENMLNTATALSKSFNARLCDHQRQPLTAAKVEEYRNEVMACNVI